MGQDMSMKIGGIGLVLLNVRWTLEREGAITLRRPAELLEAEQLEPVLSGA